MKARSLALGAALLLVGSMPCEAMDRPLTPAEPADEAASIEPPAQVSRPAPSIKVVAVAGACEEYCAVIEYAGETYVVEEGMLVPDKERPVFEVQWVDRRSVTIRVRETQDFITTRLPR
jgi:hypothetical protein